jgi:hypothetical protein
MLELFFRWLWHTPDYGAMLMRLTVFWVETIALVSMGKYKIIELICI